MVKSIRNTKKNDGYDVFTYRRIRRAIGYLAISLPIILVLSSCFDFFKTPVQASISHYYYTNLREVFTGTLFAVGLFLIRYEGHGNASIWKNDKLMTNIAGIMAIGVAFVPTNIVDKHIPEPIPKFFFTIIPLDQEWLGWLHYGFAGVLFFILALLAINVFTIGQKIDSNMPKSIVNENNIYRFCGYSILVFIVMVPIYKFSCSTLLFEALSLFAFGIAWLIKGRALGDQGKIGQKLYRENNKSNTEEVIKA